MKIVIATHIKMGCFFGRAFFIDFKGLDIKLLRVVPVVDLRR